MTIEQLREARGRQPFRSFEIRLSGGEQYTIRHPDNIAWDEDSRTATLLAGRAWVVIDVDLVTSLSTPLPERRQEVGQS